MMLQLPNKITAIVPRLPPSVDGVGDYGLILAQTLSMIYGVNTNFIVTDTTWKGGAKVAGFSVQTINTHSVIELLNLLPSDAQSIVLLHYVGYGYAKRGCPVWLVKALEQWRKQSEGRKLVIMFHEVYARSYIPWNSQFWSSWLQKQLATRLIQLCDRCATSNQIFAKIIIQLSKGKFSNLPILPVFSSIGEPNNLLPLKERLLRLVVFGQKGLRTRAYKQYASSLVEACHQLQIREIIDIGSDLDFTLDTISNIPINRMGIQSAESISQILSISVAGFISYPCAYLAKSSVFAAYCAHKLLPVLPMANQINRDGLKVSEHYWVKDYMPNINLTNAQNIADNAHNWYQEHSRKQHIKILV